MNQTAVISQPGERTKAAGQPEKVKWSAMTSPTRITANGAFQVRVQAEIASGYHLYSTSQAPGGPVPTSITLPAGQLFWQPWPHVAAAWAAPVKTFSPEFGMEVEYHVGKMIFDLYGAAKTDAAPGAHELVIEIHYQLCDKHTCLIPETKQLRVPIEVISAEAEAQPSAKGNGAGKTVAKPGRKEAMIERLRAIMQIPDKKKREAGLWQLAADCPKSDVPYQMLANPFLARADFRAATAIYRKGLAVNPNSDALHAALLGCSAKKAPRGAKQRFIRRFPRSSYTARFLGELAAEASSPAARLNLLRRAAAVNKEDFFVSFSTLSDLCWELAIKNPAAAAKLEAAWLAKRRSARVGGDMPFYIRDAAVARTEFFVALANCDGLIKRGKARAEVAAVEKVTAPDIPHLGVDDHDRVLLALMRAKVLAAAGKGQRAYDELISHDHLLMSDEMLTAAIKLGAKLGKSRRQIEADAWQQRLSAENVVADFKVPGSRGRTIKASDYLGRILLVNTWNPG